jgi:two-component system response regulator
LTILAVDDNPADRKLIRRLFAGLDLQCNLQTLSDGEQALRYLMRTGEFEDAAASPRPALILLDINLPRVNGPELLPRIRTQPELANIPVVIVSGTKHERDVERCRRYGCVAFVSKSIDLEEYRTDLLRELERWLP